MKKRISVLWMLLCVLALASCGAPQADTAPAGTTESAEIAETADNSDALDLSSFIAMGMDGELYSGEIFREKKLTVLNIWGTFCGPCIREMPDLEALSQAYGDQIQIIGIPIDITDANNALLPDGKAEAEYILSETGVDYLQILPSKSLNALFLSEIQVLPTTIFVDENGRMLDEPYYGSRDYAGWKRVIDAYLEVLP